MIGRGRNLSERRDVLHLPVRSAEPQRLDHFVLAAMNWRSRTRIQGLIHDGRIRVNGDSAKPSRKVRNGDAVSVHLSSGTGVPEDYDDRPIDVLYEDPWLVAVNKPPGLLVHPVGRHVYDTLINYLHHHYRETEGDDGQPVRPRLCHRIDRDTTGILVVGKEAYVHRDVQIQFERRFVSKEYIALVDGEYPSEEESLEVPIGEGRDLDTCLEHEVLKASRTGVRVLRRFGGRTLLSCVPHTGRQNQIRVHLASRGFPITGDRQYGAAPPPEGFPPRYLLHSSFLRFYHPRWKAWIELRAPLPEDFRHTIDRLEASATPSV
ncbi:MAG TPA: RluA family pseudouridine synthase [Planctomycetota bacterium]|nr:RluA family pseudouridine synthase [Planctomycetota bacterium]